MTSVSTYIPAPLGTATSYLPTHISHLSPGPDLKKDNLEPRRKFYLWISTYKLVFSGCLMRFALSAGALKMLQLRFSKGVTFTLGLQHAIKYSIRKGVRILDTAGKQSLGNIKVHIACLGNRKLFGGLTWEWTSELELGEKLKRKARIGLKMLLNRKNLLPYLGNVELLD